MVRWQWNILEGYGLLDYHGDDGDEGEEDCENRREIGAMIWRARLCSFWPRLLRIHDLSRSFCDLCVESKKRNPASRYL
jgi:hypothetical protein